MKISLRLTLASLVFAIGCASIDGTPESTSAARPSASRTSGAEVTDLATAQQRIRDLERQVEDNVRDYGRIADVARRATEEAARRRAEAERANARPAPTPAPVVPPSAPVAPMPNVGMVPPGMPGVSGMPGAGLAAAPQNPGYPVMVPPYGVVNNTAWVGRPAPSQMIGGDVPYIELRVSGRAQYATVITARDGTLICPSIATAIVTVGRRQLCAVPAGPSWRAVLETYSPGRHEFVVYYYRMNSYSGQGHLVNPGGTVVAGNTETYPNVDLP